MVAKGKIRELEKLSKKEIACDQCNLSVGDAQGDGTSKNIEKDKKNLSGQENYTFPLLALLNQPETAEWQQAAEEIKEHLSMIGESL